MAKKTGKTKGQSAVDEALASTPRADVFDPSKLGAIERPKGLKTIVDSMAWWKFVENPLFKGNFVSVIKAEKDDKSRQRKKGDTMGYLFVQHGTEREFAIPNAHAITTALEAKDFSKKTNFWIEFQGKVTREGKNPYNRFYVAEF